MFAPEGGTAFLNFLSPLYLSVQDSVAATVILCLTLCIQWLSVNPFPAGERYQIFFLAILYLYLLCTHIQPLSPHVYSSDIIIIIFLFRHYFKFHIHFSTCMFSLYLPSFISHSTINIFLYLCFFLLPLLSHISSDTFIHHRIRLFPCP